MGNTRPGAVRHSSAHSLMSTSKGSMPPMPPPLPPPLPPPTPARPHPEGLEFEWIFKEGAPECVSEHAPGSSDVCKTTCAVSKSLAAQRALYCGSS